MRNIILGMSALALAAVSAPAFAQEEAAPALTVTGGATVVSDYRFRGVSQTNKRFAVQGSMTLTHESGVYAGVWGSSIDDYVAAGSDQEIDLMAGYSRAFGPATVDVGVLYYYYPNSGGGNTDFIEPYASVKGTFGPATAKVGIAYAPKAHALAAPGGTNSRDDNTYIYADLSGTLPEVPVSLTAHIGESYGRSFLTGGLKNYTDWSLGASYTWNHITFGISYVDTDIKKSDSPQAPGFFMSGTRALAKAGVVGSIGVSF